MSSQEHINEQLKVLLSEDLKVISYKWLARKFGLPCNLAKQTLFAFLEQHRGKVKATYLLAGWTSTQPRQHTVQLVDSEHLSTRRSALDPVTSMHVYSLQPTQPKDASELWNHDAIQTSELFQELKLGQTNCLADNRWSAVKCLEAKHDPSLAKRAPAAVPSADGDAAGPSKPAQKPTPNSVAGQIAGIMGGSAKQGGVATASVAVKGSGSSSIQNTGEAQIPERDSVTTAIAPSGAAPLSGPASGGPSAAPSPGVGAGKRKGGKSRLANMWSKAPAVKEKPQQAAKSKNQAALAVDADAAVRSAQQADSSSDSEEEDFLPIKRGAQQRSKRIEEDEEEGSPVKPAGRQAKKAKVSETNKVAVPAKARQSALEEPEEEVSAECADPPAKKAKGKAATDSKKKASAVAKKPPAKKPPARKSVSKQIESDEEMSDADIEVSLEEEDQQQETQGECELTQGEKQGTSQGGKGKKGGKRAAANKPGSVKAGSAAAGPKRRKVMRTTINDKGEEVTEEVWEDSQEASASGQQEDQADGGEPQVAVASSAAGNSPAAESPEKTSQDDALKEQPGNGVANAGKSAVVKSARASKSAAPAAKRGASKAAAKDQRGIMSFFAKK